MICLRGAQTEETRLRVINYNDRKPFFKITNHLIRKDLTLSENCVILCPINRFDKDRAMGRKKLYDENAVLEKAMYAFWDKGYKRLNIVENTITGEIYLIFTKMNGLEMKANIKANQKKVTTVGCNRRDFTDLMCKFLNLDTTNKINITMNLSSNISRVPEQVTYRIEMFNRKQ